MRKNIGGGTLYLAKCVLFFFIIFVLSCTSTSVMRLEGNDFKENLPGRWEGKWIYGAGRSDIEWLKIIKIDGDKVHLTGYSGGGGSGIAADEVYGRIENSILYLTWTDTPEGICNEELSMIRDDSNNLVLDGLLKCGNWHAKVRLKKIE